MKIKRGNPKFKYYKIPNKSKKPKSKNKKPKFKTLLGATNMVLNSESAMERWLKIEFHSINKNLVKNQMTIDKLLKMDIPKTVTRGGEDYIFDNQTLKKFSESVPQIFHRRLQLPVYFYRDLRVKDSCFLSDEVVVTVLKHTNDLEFGYNFSDGKLWLSRPIAFDIARKYPTLFQFVIY